MVKAEVAKHFTCEALESLKKGNVDNAILNLEMFLSSMTKKDTGNEIRQKRTYKKRKNNEKDEIKIIQNPMFMSTDNKDTTFFDEENSIHLDENQKKKKENNDEDSDLKEALDDLFRINEDECENQCENEKIIDEEKNNN